MHPMEGLAGQMAWAGRNTAYNLEFIPEDRLDWKPAPTAKSALEVVNHVAYFIVGAITVLRDGAWREPQYERATDLASAKELLTRSTGEFAAALRAVSPADLGREIALPFGRFSLARAATMTVIDMIHHHGQIAYIQTLLGDEEFHFVGDPKD